MEVEFETVHAVYDVFDKPISGVADFHGVPHEFKCIFSDDADDWTDLYELRQVQPKCMNAVRRQELRVKNWRLALCRGEARVGDPIRPLNDDDVGQFQADLSILSDSTFGPHFVARALAWRFDHFRSESSPGVKWLAVAAEEA